jgi:curved DNA-binding protein CbpA
MEGAASLVHTLRAVRAWRTSRSFMSGNTQDPYRVLMLQRGATKMEVRARYLELAKLLHPDSPAGSNPAAFAQVSNAYEQLRSSFAREGPVRYGELSSFDEDGDMSYLMKLRRCVSTFADFA